MTLKELRKNKGLTQAELAKRLGFTSSAVTQYESGVRTPDVHTIKKIAEILGVSIETVVECFVK